MGKESLKYNSEDTGCSLAKKTVVEDNVVVSHEKVIKNPERLP